MLKIIKFIELLDHSLLSVMNDSEFCFTDSNGKLFIDLEKKNVQDILYFFIRSFLKDKRVFGANGIIAESCHPKNNWRNTDIAIEVGDYKYKIVDGSVNIDLGLLEAFIDRTLKKLRHDEKNYCYVVGETIDIYDFKAIIENKFKFECNDGVSAKTFILADNNVSFPHGKIFYDPQYLEVEMVLIKNGLY